MKGSIPNISQPSWVKVYYCAMSLDLVSVHRGCDRDLWRVVWQPINREAILHARRVLSEADHGAEAMSKRTSSVGKSKVIKKSQSGKVYYAKWSRGVLGGHITRCMHDLNLMFRVLLGKRYARSYVDSFGLVLELSLRNRTWVENVAMQF